MNILGTYGKNHVPYTVMEEKTRGKGFSFSIIPPFDKNTSRLNNLYTGPSYQLPPNLYTLKSCTEELISKKVSKRGPYDLFTG